jgi:hypothetical protein
MTETFDLPVDYKNEELCFKSKLMKWGYTHRFEVQINGDTIFFEPDEEKNYRAMTDPNNFIVTNVIDVELLKQIATTLNSLMQ